MEGILFKKSEILIFKSRIDKKPKSYSFKTGDYIILKDYKFSYSVILCPELKQASEKVYLHICFYNVVLNMIFNCRL